MAKNHFIRARVAGWEKFVISENARKARMTESEFVRRAALEKDVVVIDGAAELLTELRRQGNNLNQLRCWPGSGGSSWWTSSPLWRCIRTHGER